MFKILLFMFLSLTIQVQAARYILEDAKLNLQPFDGYQVIKKLQIGEKTYTIVETPEFYATAEEQNLLFKKSGATRVVEDVKIYLDFPIEEALSEAKVGWHVDRMGYDRLDPNYQGQGVVVAVLDTGVDIYHPQLSSKIWRNPYEIPDNNIDDDANGYIDDIYGWNFVRGDNNVLDYNRHGTHCAGIIVADQHSESKSRGIAPAAQIMSVKIIGSDRYTFLSTAAEAVVYASNNGARILSNSWGLYNSYEGFNLTQERLQIFIDAMAHAYYRGVVYIASAGNDSLNLNVTNSKDLRVPLGLSGIYNMLGIASSDFDGINDKPSRFTNTGNQYVHFAAPGSDIVSTVPGGEWASLSGTSMATPLFAGLMARLLSKGYTWIEAAYILRDTVDQKAQPVWEGKIMHGQIHPVDALNR